MTLNEIVQEVKSISEVADKDYEVAHEKEDALYFRFIEYVASCDNPELAEKARTVLVTKEISFLRCCA